MPVLPATLTIPLKDFDVQSFRSDRFDSIGQTGDNDLVVKVRSRPSAR